MVNCRRYFFMPEEFPFGKILTPPGDENRQEIDGFAMQKEASNNFAAFRHEDNPEEWIDLADEFDDRQTFASGLQTLVENEGRRPL